MGDNDSVNSDLSDRSKKSSTSKLRNENRGPPLKGKVEELGSNVFTYGSRNPQGGSSHVAGTKFCT